MTSYARMYRLGITPWEKYGAAAAASIAAMLDREEQDRSAPLGRALDIGCGRGQFTPGLGRRGWDAVGLDYVPAAVDAARNRGTGGVTYVAGDITDLAAADLGRFDFFLDIGCFQGLDASQRRAAGETVSALANPDAKVLMLAFGPGRFRSLVGGVSQADVAAAFPGWELSSVHPADTTGLGWPMMTSRAKRDGSPSAMRIWAPPQSFCTSVTSVSPARPANSATSRATPRSDKSAPPDLVFAVREYGTGPLREPRPSSWLPSRASSGR